MIHNQITYQFKTVPEQSLMEHTGFLILILEQLLGQDDTKLTCPYN